MKNMKLNKLIYAVTGITILAVSCTKDLERINTNPNQLAEVNPEYLFNTSVYQTLNASCGEMKKIALDNYVQYNYGQTNQFGRYGNVPSTNSKYFKNFYNYALLPAHFIIEKKSEDPECYNKVLIARIWKAYIFSQVTSIWGPVPMSKALTGKTSIPYDDEQTIYRSLLDELKYCAENINPEGDVYINDPVFPSGSKSSDLTKWIKFANSLRLRLAVRICNADRTLAVQHIEDIFENEDMLISSNDDNCIIYWGDNESTRNYYYDYFIVQSENMDKANSAGEAFLMHTAPYSDPRLPKFFTPCTSSNMPENFHWAPYWGKPKTDHTPVSGLYDGTNPHSGIPATEYSLMLDSYFAMSYGQMIMSCAETNLLKAEAVHLGLASGSATAENYYKSGILASMEQFGVTSQDAITEYMNADGIEFGTCTDLELTQEGEAYYKDYLGLSSSIIRDSEEDPLYHQIIMQQYIAMFNQALDTAQTLTGAGHSSALPA